MADKPQPRINLHAQPSNSNRFYIPPKRTYTNEYGQWHPPPTEPREPSMLEKIFRLYTTAMVTGVTSPLPHLFGPPGSGKSKVCQQAADIIGVNLHTINLSRVSPLELEGVQMPTTGEDMKLRLLHATYWTQIKEGDIVLFDEFLRAFPEVHNGLLDILTAREVGGMKIPRAFFMGASNSVIAYDKALEDRLLHIPVPDPRKLKSERTRLAQIIVGALGLLPDMADSSEMQSLIASEVEPMYEVMDSLKKRNAPPSYEGSSVRNLIGQALLREVQSTDLRALLDFNNMRAAQQQKWQYILLVDAKHPPAGYADKAAKLKDNPKLSEIQRQNATLNLELIEFESTKHDLLNRTGGTP
jgi:AAA domain (dynein-related subfamily)